MTNLIIKLRSQFGTLGSSSRQISIQYDSRVVSYHHKLLYRIADQISLNWKSLNPLLQIILNYFSCKRYWVDSCFTMKPNFSAIFPTRSTHLFTVDDWTESRKVKPVCAEPSWRDTDAIIFSRGRCWSCSRPAMSLVRLFFRLTDRWIRLNFLLNWVKSQEECFNIYCRYAELIILQKI